MGMALATNKVNTATLTDLSITSLVNSQECMVHVPQRHDMHAHARDLNLLMVDDQRRL
jgi:hypothetical protein